jgi:biotin carboxyl carrier protein
MRYFASAEGQKEPTVIDIERRASGGFKVTIGGKTHELDALAPEPGTLSLLLGAESYSVEIQEQQDELLVSMRDLHLRIDLVDERKRRQRAAAGSLTVEGRQVITAPMPGKVVKVLVRVGEEVQEGQGLIVVEAMKMENELKSPKAGKVVELLAQEGSTVENNAKLVVVE